MAKKFRTNSQLEYAEHIKDIVSRYGDDLDRYDALVIQYLRTASDRLTEKLLRLSRQSQWSAWHYEQLRTDVKRILDEFEKNFNGVVEKAVQQSIDNGISATVEPLARQLNMNMYFGSPDVFIPAFKDEWTLRLVDLTKTRIKDAMGATENKIMQEILTATMSDIPRHEIINNIMDTLKGDIGGQRALAGFTSLNARARTILRTESMKIHNLSTQMQGAWTASQFNGQGDKMWLHGVFHTKAMSKKIAKMSGKAKQRFYTPRLGHQMLNETQVAWNEYFINPITQSVLLYPHDEKADASEVISCGCAHYYVPPKEALMTEREILSLAV